MKKIISISLASLALITIHSSLLAFEALPENVPNVPDNNPMTAAKIELGKQLFFDPRLSIDGTISCNSCHNVMAGGTDNRAVSVGVGGQKGERSAPTVWNAAFLSSQFWDGRAATLEEQAKGPILASVEMGMPSEAAVIKRIKSIPGYVQSFATVFGGLDAITYDNIAKAIATYERTLITVNSPFDRYQRGEKTALSGAAIRGMKTVASAGCTACHSGPNFSGPSSLPIGEVFLQKFPTFEDNKYVAKYDLKADKGRYNVTHKTADTHMWRVPTWRNVGLTAPYFHNGLVETLDEAVRVMAKTQLNTTFTSEQVSDVVAFLNSLTGEFPQQTMPRLPNYNNASMVDLQ